MALYVNGKKVKLRLNGAVCQMHLGENAIPGDRLLSTDNFILKDSNGLYLIPQSSVPFNAAMSLDDYVLQDLNSLYITLKESE